VWFRGERLELCALFASAFFFKAEVRSRRGETRRVELSAFTLHHGETIAIAHGEGTLRDGKAIFASFRLDMWLIVIRTRSSNRICRWNWSSMVVLIFAVVVDLRRRLSSRGTNTDPSTHSREPLEYLGPLLSDRRRRHHHHVFLDLTYQQSERKATKTAIFLCTLALPFALEEVGITIRS